MKKNINSDNPLLFKIVMLVSGLLVGFITVKSVFFMMKINTDSMNPALKRGDRILINKFSKISKGNIIAFYSPSEDGKILVARVIATEYETVEIRNKIIFINDKKAEVTSDQAKDQGQIYPMKFCYRDNMPPVKIGRNEFFVLGDNFDRSYDSRTFGKISKDIVIGRLVYKR